MTTESSADIVVIQNNIHEGPGCLTAWAKTKTSLIDVVHPYPGGDEPLPTYIPKVLFILGGPQSPDDYRDEMPYLLDVMAYIRRCAISKSCVVVGFCLGAQLIGEVYSAPVSYFNDGLATFTGQSPMPEVGLFPLSSTGAGQSDSWASKLDGMAVMHWHNDMPPLPKGAIALAESVGCPRQLVRYDYLVYGLQFHPEMTAESVATMVSAFPRDVPEQSKDPFRMSGKDLLNLDPARFEPMNRWLMDWLDDLWEKVA